MKLHLLCIISISVLAIACGQESTPLEGSWEMVSAVYTSSDTTERIVLSDIRQTKILSKHRFAFGRQQDEGAFAGGGRYTFGNGKYTETIDFHSNSDLIGQDLEFEARLEGDSLWYHTGNIGENFLLEEVWRRVDY